MLADRQRLNQVLLNLLSNAVKYNREGGTRDGRLHRASNAALRHLGHRHRRRHSAGKLQLLFQPFERLGAGPTAIEGTGLGLALSRGWPKRWAARSASRAWSIDGSTFWVELRARRSRWDADAASCTDGAATDVAPRRAPAPSSTSKTTARTCS